MHIQNFERALKFSCLKIELTNLKGWRRETILGHKQLHELGSFVRAPGVGLDLACAYHTRLFGLELFNVKSKVRVVDNHIVMWNTRDALGLTLRWWHFEFVE